ncbi:tetratricopeptide repeat protein, partial [Orrella sp. 11846]|uniref:tetratricopeptide repeat protein n=1 Tax=Orrella sp. 11846 TaxID=3409913 RepID=UPI003B5CE9B5
MSDQSIQRLQEENDLLLEQLHLVQEELEKYYLENKRLQGLSTEAITNKPSGQSSTAKSELRWVDERWPDVLAENESLKTQVEVMRYERDIVLENSLSAHLGKILIRTGDGEQGVTAALKQLLTFWKKSRQQSVPNVLGDKHYSKVVETYKNQGIKAVEKLLKDADVSFHHQASAYTAISRFERDEGQYDKALSVSERAYEIDPKPFRLKWLAFRCADAGQTARAVALLDLLPEDTPMSESETNKMYRYRQIVEQQRRQEAIHRSGFVKAREDLQARISTLETQAQTLQNEKTELEKQINEIQKK